jgi:hypothetical protein
MKIPLIIAAIILSSYFAFSQDRDSSCYSISGKIIANLGIGQFAISESIIFLSGAKGDGTISNENGEFRFEKLKIGKYKLEFISDYGLYDTLINIENQDISGIKIVFYYNCEFSKESALQDIRNRRPKLLIFGGIAPSFNVYQHKFEKKYKIEYMVFGDDGPPPYECVLEYNLTVFKSLTEKYGNKWRSEVRQDVVGLK